MVKEKPKETESYVPHLNYNALKRIRMRNRASYDNGNLHTVYKEQTIRISPKAKVRVYIRADKISSSPRMKKSPSKVLV